MNRCTFVFSCARSFARFAAWFAVVGSAVAPCGAAPIDGFAGLYGVLLSAEQVTADTLMALKSAQGTAVVLMLESLSPVETRRERVAAEHIRRVGLELYYWIEVARHPGMAQAHPEWMSSVQGHGEWRRLHPDAPRPGEGEVVKNFPWVPIGYRESFDAHLQRVAAMLERMPKARGVFLNDLQGGPSACGCGNPLCRWTGDYGPKRTATSLGDDAAARFVAAVKRLASDSRVIPVWTTECAEHDGAADGLCAGVNCFEGICWRAYTAQLMPLAREVDQLAVLLVYRELKQDSSHYKQPAGWVRQALASFVTMPPRRGGEAIATDRLIAVVQGWDVSPTELDDQIARVREAGAAGCIVARTKIDQGWQPRIVPVRK